LFTHSNNHSYKKCATKASFVGCAHCLLTTLIITNRSSSSVTDALINSTHISLGVLLSSARQSVSPKSLSCRIILHFFLVVPWGVFYTLRFSNLLYDTVCSI